MADHRKIRSDESEDRRDDGRSFSQKPPNGTENKALMTVDKKRRRTGDGSLPTADGGHALGSRSASVRMSDTERRNLWGRLSTLLLITVVMALAVLIFLFRPTPYTERTHSVAFLYVPERESTVVVVDGQLEGDKNGYPGKLTYRADNGKGDVCAAIIGNALYVVDGDDVEKLGDNVTDCTVSAGGSHVAWRNTAEALYYAEVGDAESFRCASEYSPDGRYCLSPNGNELLYTYMGADGISRIALISLSGNSLIFREDQNLFPVAVADDSIYLYYTNGQGALYVLNRDSGVKTLCGEAPAELIFNADLSQLLMRNGTESRLFVEGERFVINGLESTDHLELLSNRRAAVLPLGAGYHCLIDSFLEQYYICHTQTETGAKATTRLIYLTEDDDRGEMSQVAYGVANVTVTDKYVFFLQTVTSPDTHTELFCVETGDTESELCYGYVTDYCTNVDGSRLAYVSQTGLYSGRAGEMMEWLSDYIVRERGVEVTCDDAFYYFATQGELYVSDNGETARHLCSGVDWFLVDGDTVIYGVGFSEGGSGTVYANFRNSRKSDLLLGGVSEIG